VTRMPLPHLLQTAFIVTVSPAANALDETVSTFQFAERAKKVVQHATVNETLGSCRRLLLLLMIMCLRHFLALDSCWPDDPSQIRRYQHEIAHLRKQLREAQSRPGSGRPVGDDGDGDVGSFVFPAVCISACRSCCELCAWCCGAAVSSAELERVQEELAHTQSELVRTKHELLVALEEKSEIVEVLVEQFGGATSVAHQQSALIDAQRKVGAAARAVCGRWSRVACK
jgi:hypothetical protein